MRSPNRRRSIILLIALLLPSTALVGIAVRMLRQQHELEQRRATQAERGAVLQAGRALEVALDRIPPDAGGDSVVVFAAAAHDGAFRLPWEAAGSDTGAAARVTRSLYRARSRAEYEQLLRAPLSVRDDEGMPVALYAADWLIKHGADRSVTERRFRGAGRDMALSPPALYALRSFQHGGDSIDTEVRLREAEGIDALHSDYSALAKTHRRGDWVLYGAERWLVRADSNRVAAIRPAALLRKNGVRLAEPANRGAEPLGGAFPGVYATVIDPVTPSAGGTGGLVALLALAISLTVVSALILRNDVQREIAMAELRTQFVSSVSHELKTPLTAIRMYAEMLRMGMVPPSREDEFAETMVAEAERLSRLINNVLDFSRMERGERVFQREAVDLQELARLVEAAATLLGKQRGFDLSIAVPPNLPHIYADRDALVQAILNLISNAMKFSEQSRKIELSFAADDGRVTVKVTDFGRGIRADVQSRIFERFYRAPDVEADGIPGTGIGLALVQNVAQGHGGCVTVESREGAGSTFSLSIPTTA